VTNTIQRFSWKGRDAAARDLLQLVYHAPERIGYRALELLKAIRSPEVVPELLSMFRNTTDKSISWTEHIRIFEAIAATPADLYLPEMEEHFDLERRKRNHNDTFERISYSLAANNPRNQEWLFALIDKLSPKTRLHRLKSLVQAYYVPKSLRPVLYDRLLNLLETQATPLTLEWLDVLHGDPRQTTREWLAERWRELVYLCISTYERRSMYDLISILDNWTELKALVFYCCPSFISDYVAYKAHYQQRWPHAVPVDITQLALWHKLSSMQPMSTEDYVWIGQTLDGRRDVDILEKTLVLHYVGQSPELTKRYFYSIENKFRIGTHYRQVWQGADRDRPEVFCDAYPMRFEAGEILRDHPSPEVWEILVSEYFRAVNFFEAMYILEWITYQTDVLSGIDSPDKGRTYPVGLRPWFQALAAREAEQDAEQRDWAETVPPLWTHPTAALSFGVE
jgi:hypothetical protein